MFDKCAAAFWGLDESKYEWAKVERELMERQELEDIANNNVQVADRERNLEAGLERHVGEQALAEPLRAGMRMSRPPDVSQKPRD